MKRVISVFLMFILLTILDGCETNTDCLLEVGDGIKVTLLEEGTNASITTGNPVGFVRIESHIDSLRVQKRLDSVTSPIVLRAWIQRTGIYSVFVELEGYEPWREDNVKIVMEPCQLGSANLTAFLKKK